MPGIHTSLSPLTALVALIATYNTVGAVSASNGASGALRACHELQKSLSSITSFPGSTDFILDTAHYVPTSSQNSTCGVAPTTIQDVQTIIKLVGRDDIRSPFAIASGGHTYNPGFSSTPGVQISMRDFRDFHYDASSQTVKVGSGWVFNDIYAELAPYNVTVVGARSGGVGAGFTYGGGYSWYTNQHGLGIDNTVAYDLVLPNGTYVEVTEAAQPDLFFALRGGLNNFGIITSTTMKTVPSAGVFAGNVAYSFDYNEEIMEALEDFSLNNKDVKAQLVAALLLTEAESSWFFTMFYDAPDPSPAALQPFLSIPMLSSTLNITTHAAYVNSSRLAPGSAGFQDTTPVLKYTVPVIKKVQTAMNTTLQQILKDGRGLNNILWAAEPFHGHFEHAKTPSAYPHDASYPITPSSAVIAYQDSKDMDYFKNQMKKLSGKIQTAVVEEGQGKWDDVKYSNYALAGTPLEDLFGENVKRLRQLKAKVDRKNVMGLLKEGFLL